MDKRTKKDLKHMYNCMPFQPKISYCFEILPIIFKEDDKIYWRVCQGTTWQELFSSVKAAYNRAKYLQTKTEDVRTILINTGHCKLMIDYLRRNPAIRHGWQITE